MRFSDADASTDDEEDEFYADDMPRFIEFPALAIPNSQRISCAAHLFQNVLENGMKSTFMKHPGFKAIQKMASTFRKSTVCTRLLEDALGSGVKKRRFLAPSTTRWAYWIPFISVYFSLESEATRTEDSVTISKCVPYYTYLLSHLNECEERYELDGEILLLIAGLKTELSRKCQRFVDPDDPIERILLSKAPNPPAAPQISINAPQAAMDATSFTAFVQQKRMDAIQVRATDIEQEPGLTGQILLLVQRLRDLQFSATSS
uniref:Uncharacterized protein n=1 Tax=Ditylenchus dipsaci TaxID=166011 RepID=A0A915EE50_9BILA